MNINKIEIGKEYYKINNNGYISELTCLKNDGIQIMVKIHAKKGFGGGRLEHLNAIECERYIISEK